MDPILFALPDIESLKLFYQNADAALAQQAADWMPCLKKGCCTGDAYCSRHSMAASIAYTEMEALWDAIRGWPEANRRRAAEVARAQYDLALAQTGLASKTEAETISLFELKQFEEALSAGNHVCPILNDDPTSPDYNTCRAYAVRPLVCRAFGQAAVTVSRGKDSDGAEMMDAPFCGCDTAFAAAQEHPDHLFTNFTALKNILLEVAAPKVVGVGRVPLVAKPIPAWLVDLTDDSGDLTNPRDIFNSIRAMIIGTLKSYLPQVETLPGAAEV